jgi:hypothetical protein
MEVRSMLSLSLVLSLCLLVIANWAIRRSANPTFTMALNAAGFSLVPVALSCFFPALALQSLLLVLVVAASVFFHWKPRTFLAASCAATLASYGVAAWVAFQEYTQLRDQFPYLSMEERLPPRNSSPEQNLAPDLHKQLAAFEVRLDELLDEHRDRLGWVNNGRVRHLQELHENAVEVFISRPGFGVARMPGVSEWTLKRGLREEEPLSQPGPRSTLSWSADFGAMQPLLRNGAAARKDLLSMHQRGVVDFVHPAGFGFVKDRRHVAGFQEHQFSEVPESVEPWKLHTLDLVGLVIHEDPVAYVSGHLPRMDELRQAPTRPLDTFEVAGLKALRRGQDLVVRDLAPVRRVLGSIRSARQCLSCHGGQRGDLLGAFSYTLVRRN